ncbi:MAG TPA: transglycosylase SLT domain-containing protein [Pyrinomonadaceae bacterium]|nr:transglycosylase SLT domain-containing protein [Pyrinomonadaceae bacterium]
MTRTPIRLVSGAFFAASLFFPAIIQAQGPAGSGGREIQTEVQKADPRIDQVIERANDHFRKGKLNLEDNKRYEARDEFDKAVDEVLTSGLDVRANQRLQTFYLELVERIYREEVPMIQTAPQQQQNATPVVAQSAPNANAEKVEVAQVQEPKPVQIGFRQQEFEPSPLDALSKLILNDDEKKVSDQEIAALEQAKNALDFNFTLNPLVQQYINYYQGRGRSTMEAGLRRSGRFMKIARDTFRREGVPEDITWLGQVESAWIPKNVSWAGASGLWQFVRGTGTQYGLRQTAWVDERNGIEKPTAASARYLKDLARRYNGDWLLAMAAYNTGALNVDRAISRAGEANYWKIYPYIAQETRNYVPNILAVIMIAKNPEKYGFHSIRPETPMAFETIPISSSTSLRLVADATGTSVDAIQALNPELRRDVTPRGESYNLRVPSGSSKQLASLLKRVPSDRSDSTRVISIVPGEDLQSVANRTGVSVATLQAMNGGVDLKTTTRLLVPNSSVRLTNWKRSATPESNSQPALTKVRARKGDTIAKIAAAHKLSADEVARINGIAPNVELPAGQEIKLPGATATAPATGSRRR